MKDVEEKKFEEIADIPENITVSQIINGSTVEPVSEPEPDKNLEEVSDVPDGASSSKPIIDEYDKSDLSMDEEKIFATGETDSAGAAMSDASGALTGIPENIEDGSLEGFNFDDIGKIDLKEAEEIANEDQFFMTESEIIEGLEDLDLIPLKDKDTGKEVDIPDKAEAGEDKEASSDEVEAGEDKEASSDEIEITEEERVNGHLKDDLPEDDIDREDKEIIFEEADSQEEENIGQLKDDIDEHINAEAIEKAGPTGREKSGVIVDIVEEIEDTDAAESAPGGLDESDMEIEHKKELNDTVSGEKTFMGDVEEIEEEITLQAVDDSAEGIRQEPVDTFFSEEINDSLNIDDKPEMELEQKEELADAIFDTEGEENVINRYKYEDEELIGKYTGGLVEEELAAGSVEAADVKEPADISAADAEELTETAADMPEADAEELTETAADMPEAGAEELTETADVPEAVDVEEWRDDLILLDNEDVEEDNGEPASGIEETADVKEPADMSAADAEKLTEPADKPEADTESLNADEATDVEELQDDHILLENEGVEEDSGGLEDTAEPLYEVHEHTGEEESAVDAEEGSRTDDLQPAEKFNGDVLFIGDEDIEEVIEREEEVVIDKEIEDIRTDSPGTGMGMGKILPEVELEEYNQPGEDDVFRNDSECEEVWLDFDDTEYKYRDSELDLIDSAIVGSDNDKYIEETDDFDDIEDSETASGAIELFGLESKEINVIEDQLFPGDYKDKDHPYEAMIIEKEAEVEITALGAADIEEPVYDITDKIVIIEDEDDVNRFLDEFPGNKQDDLKKLFKYLDGLFEKLPENTIKNFADSEYFDLYTKILNDIGINNGLT